MGLDEGELTAIFAGDTEGAGLEVKYKWAGVEGDW